MVNSQDYWCVCVVSPIFHVKHHLCPFGRDFVQSCDLLTTVVAGLRVVLNFGRLSTLPANG